MVTATLLQPYIEVFRQLNCICENSHLRVYEGHISSSASIRIVPFCNDIWIITPAHTAHYGRLKTFVDVTIDEGYCIIIISDDRSCDLPEKSCILDDFIASSKTPYSCINYINSLLPPVNVPDRASYIKEMIISENGNITADYISTHTGYCNRHINRIFTDSFGYGPKQFCKAIRLAAVIIEIIDNPQRSNVDFINNSGYSDQSHFQREFRAFMGETPKNFIKRLEKKI